MSIGEWLITTADSGRQEPSQFNAKIWSPKVKIQRESIHVIRLSEDNDDGYVQAMPNELLEMMWEITRDAWAFRGGEGAERRLQRNVTHLDRRRS